MGPHTGSPERLPETRTSVPPSRPGFSLRGGGRGHGASASALGGLSAQ